MTHSIRYLLYVSAVLLVLSSSCSDDINRSEGRQVPISLSASVSGTEETKAKETIPAAGYNLAFSSLLTEDENKTYHNCEPAHLGSTGTVTFDDGNPRYYPFEDKELRFVLHNRLKTNVLAIDGTDMVVYAGNTPDHDIIMGNNATGKRSTENGSKNIDMYHIMTKVEVIIIKDGVTLDPATLNLGLQMSLATDALNKRAKFPRTALQGEGDYKATSVETGYQLQMGANYLPATGGNLSGINITRLSIDDYSATQDDLASLKIPKYADGSSTQEFILEPGVSYQLTITIKQLKIEGISLTLLPWTKITITNPDMKYEAKRLTLDLNQYNDKDITKVVLYDTDGKQYVGNMDNGFNPNNRTTSNLILPTNCNKVELYTDNGLLVSASGAITFDSYESKLTIDLCEVGAATVTPASAYNADTNPYAITTPLQFYKITNGNDDALSKSYRQTEDLIFTDIPLVGNTGKTFTGVYDGNGYDMIDVNMTSSGSGTDFGLFSANSGTLKDINIVGGLYTSTSTSGSNVGSICGSNTGTIVACKNCADITSVGGNLGGICGSTSSNSVITACLNTGALNLNSATGNVGGIIGEAGNTSSIASCVNVGMIKSNTAAIYGICGNFTDTPSFETCYWLTGTARKSVGATTETGIGGGYTYEMSNDICDLSPERLRDESLTCSELNSKIVTGWADKYEFKVDYDGTGYNWCAPMKKTD